MHISVAAYLGLSKPVPEARPAPNRAEVERELSALAGPSRGKFVPPIPIRPAGH